jgi:hypothetical protein
MPHLPRLRVVPLESIRRHEEVDPLRVDRLRQRMGTEGVQVNPMVCIETAGDEMVLLDGATRTEAMKGMGLGHAAVQLVEEDSVSLGTWHHVVRGAPTDDFVSAISEPSEMELTTAEWPPTIHLNDGRTFHARGVALSPNATLAHLVRSYIGHWRVNRSPESDLTLASRNYGDWTAVIEFPALTVEEVMKAALGHDLLPAGVTRFLVPERALRLNMPLELLEDGGDIQASQAALDDLIAERAREGRIRRYSEPVIILDD